jgi:DNA-binding transcriptional regulator YdaS (Cro superfamily)
MFDKDDVVRMLRAAVEREGGQSTFARLHGVHPSYVNKILNGRARVTKSVAKALGLREVYVAE